MEDKIVKYTCNDCDLEFLIGETADEKHSRIHCPFCGSATKTESIAHQGDDQEIELPGCLALYIKEEEEQANG